MNIIILATQNDSPPRDIGVATSSINFFRSVGGSVGVSLFGALFQARFSHALVDAVGSQAVALQAASMTPEKVPQLPEASRPPPAHPAPPCTVRGRVPPRRGTGGTPPTLRVRAQTQVGRAQGPHAARTDHLNTLFDHEQDFLVPNRRYLLENAVDQDQGPVSRLTCSTQVAELCRPIKRRPRQLGSPLGLRQARADENRDVAHRMVAIRCR